MGTSVVTMDVSGTTTVSTLAVAPNELRSMIFRSTLGVSNSKNQNVSMGWICIAVIFSVSCMLTSGVSSMSWTNSYLGKFL